MKIILASVIGVISFFFSTQSYGFSSDDDAKYVKRVGDAGIGAAEVHGGRPRVKSGGSGGGWYGNTGSGYGSRRGYGSGNVGRFEISK